MSLNVCVSPCECVCLSLVCDSQCGFVPLSVCDSHSVCVLLSDGVGLGECLWACSLSVCVSVSQCVSVSLSVCVSLYVYVSQCVGSQCVSMCLCVASLCFCLSVCV